MELAYSCIFKRKQTTTKQDGEPASLSDTKTASYEPLIQNAEEL